MPDGDWSREQTRTVFVRSRARGTEPLTLRYRVRAHSAVFVVPPPPPPPASGTHCGVASDDVVHQ
jgi:hypothetical protein